MKETILSIIIILGVVACMASCGNNKKKDPITILPRLVASAPDSITTPDSLVSKILTASGDSIMLSSQTLTSFDKILDAFGNNNDQEEEPEEDYDFLHESTPATKAFFFRESDIKDTELARRVQLRYNFAAVMNRVVHSYEWFERMSSDVSEEEEFTKQDTLEWVRESQPILASGFIDKCLPTTESRSAAKALLNAYKVFDGHDEEGSPFHKAFQRYQEVFNGFPEIVSKETEAEFKEGFWDWYDKEQFVPGIDNIIRMNMHDYKGDGLTDEQVDSLRMAAKCEKDIDMRTILALELIKFDEQEGTILLGDILESGIYTRYLLEAWISWRSSVQMFHSPSSFSIIANNYYDRIRVKCLNTFLRHCQMEDDIKARCLLENMILCEIIHRMASLAGNGSFATRVNLCYEMFIHPRLLEQSNKLLK